ncbi:hypothetical protein ACFVT5_35830 [Streptomyces sp. NPDC058001]|uniref:hypothetical protein n=1 Tax=Streptomyces sp. NPDC058001 TaxID=3346300 RepID=UPI0036EED315
MSESKAETHMERCTSRYLPSPQMRATACRMAGEDPDTALALFLDCELGAHDGPEHAAGIVEAQDTTGRMTWVWWRSGIEMRDTCPVGSGPDDHRVDYDACGLFTGHPGQHTWESR